MIVYLDLEDTIITHWDEGLLLHPNKIKQWLDSRNVKELHIWSFAIWNDSDKEHFVTSNMKHMIETALERPILSWLSVEEMQHRIQIHEGMIYDSRTEFMQLHSKKWSFIKYCLAVHSNEECYLIDDAVPNQMLRDHDKVLDIHLININQLC